ncbi:LAMI_0B04126g1_1 [Lachancea mirantina]|uniref:Ribosomal lysine N-methyltransferase 4 n=1 Tax=Lachancea mirantina TaxID=1230905 RepID=A0A1G4IVB4_9SACH|nr:LAMI_0B04126g1_1 [Lachancea mirantina]
MTGTYVDLKTEKFLQWLEATPGFKISEKISLVNSSEGQFGRFLIAKELINRGEVLFEVPRDRLFNVLNCSLSQDGAIREKLVSSVGHWEGLVLALLHEIKLVGPESKWWAYLQVLPESGGMETLMYWSDEESGMLRPSSIIDRIGRHEAQEMYKRIMSLSNELGLTEFESTTWDEFVDAASVIMAYSFDVEVIQAQKPVRKKTTTGNDDFEDEDAEAGTVKTDGYSKSMVPLADMLNADTHLCNAHLIHSKKFLKMKAIADIPAGDQIYNFYGEHANAELLRRYGYVEWGGSKYDTAEIPLRAIVQATAEYTGASLDLVRRILNVLNESSKIEEFLESEPLVLNGYDCGVDGTISPECITVLQILVAILALPDVNSFDDAVLENRLLKTTQIGLQLVNGSRITVSVVHLWKRIVNLHLEAYPSHAFREVTPDHFQLKGNELRQQMAQCVLESEIRCLQNCFLSIERDMNLLRDSTILNMLQKRTIDDSNGSNPEPPTKRIKN